MKVFHMEQGSPEWIEIRRGKITASNLDKIITAKTGALSAQGDEMINELIEELFFPDLPQWSGNFWMDWGKQFEESARGSFVDLTGHTIEQVGFCLHENKACGCSPDALITSDGKHVSGVEIKCPRPKTHVGYVREGKLPDAYIQQVHGSMVITGLPEWHFFSFCNGWKPFHTIAKRNDYTKKLEDALFKFVDQYREAMKVAIPKLKIS